MCQKETSEPVKCLSESHDLSGRIDAYVSIFNFWPMCQFWQM